MSLAEITPNFVVSAPKKASYAKKIRLWVATDVHIDVWDDPLSDRIRCDHPPEHMRDDLAVALISAALARGRGKVVALIKSHQAAAFERHGFRREALLPGFYNGIDNCAAYAWADYPARHVEASGDANARAMQIVKQNGRVNRSTLPENAIATRRATLDDAEDIAALLKKTFKNYPTPSHVGGYIHNQLDGGMPFRLIHEDGKLVACASADRTFKARAAELTDCATLPEYRGRGFMGAILHDLMDDLRAMDFVTAFTLARAQSVGMNVVFHRLGFGYRGRMRKSCMIGEGLEDMNVWSRHLQNYIYSRK